MQRTDIDNTARVAHRQVRSSTTLNRRYVRRPGQSTDVAVSIKKSPAVSHFRSEMISSGTANVKTAQKIAPAQSHPLQTLANQRVKMMRDSSVQKTGLVSGVTAKQMKDDAIQKALTSTMKQDKKKTSSKKSNKMHFGFGRVVLALSCATVALLAIVYFVNLNMPDISLRVAAMQTGIEASYPSYVPRDYSLADITSQDGKITLNFKNSQTDSSIVLVEEKSSWDSNALLANFVKNEFSENYTTIREQGLTIYVDGSKATWVNGGVVYKLSSINSDLTKKQIKSIATSL